MTRAILLLLILFLIYDTELRAQTVVPATTNAGSKTKRGKRGKGKKSVRLYNPSAMKGIEYKPLDFKKAAQQKKGGAIVHHGKKVVGNIRSVAGFRICVNVAVKFSRL